MSTREISSCEVCENDRLISVLNLGNHPLCDDLVPLGDNRQCAEYPIEILFCRRCCTAHQRFQVPKYDLFPAEYHYRARHTIDVLNGMKQLVDDCEKTIGCLKDKKVLDIGCNDGSLLSIFKEKGARTFAIEPTDAYKDAIEAGHQTWNAYFCSEVSKNFVDEFGQPDIITFTNVFAHIENLPDLILALKIISHPQTVIVIENHYLGSILEKCQFDTFYHEHPRTYSYTSFSYIAASLNMHIHKVEFPKRYGGNIRVFLSKSGQKNVFDSQWSGLGVSEKLFGQKLTYLSEQIKEWRLQKYGLKLILDAAHMAGTRFAGEHVGLESDVSVFSFHSVKNLPTADGGMVCFSDEELDQEVRKWSWLGINKDTYQRTASNALYKWRYDVEHLGFKYHGNSIMAALGIVALKYLDVDNAYRRQIASWYDALIDEGIERVPISSNCEPSRHLYQILSDHRDQLLLALNNERIYPGVHYADNTEYSMYQYARNSCPRASYASARLLSLPMHLKLTYPDIEKVANVINEFYRNNSSTKIVEEHAKKT